MTSTYYRPRRLAGLLGAVPPAVWALTALTGLVLALVLWAGARERRAFERGKAAARAGAAFDSALVAQVAQAVALQTARTDTVVRVVVERQRDVRTVIEQVPAPVRAVPEVGQLIGVTEGLSVAVDTLLGAITAERAAWTERARVDSAARWSLQVLASARGDTIRVLAKRPTRTTLVLSSALTLLLGLVVR